MGNRRMASVAGSSGALLQAQQRDACRHGCVTSVRSPRGTTRPSAGDRTDGGITQRVQALDRYMRHMPFLDQGHSMTTTAEQSPSGHARSEIDGGTWASDSACRPDDWGLTASFRQSGLFQAEADQGPGRCGTAASRSGEADKVAQRHGRCHGRGHLDGRGCGGGSTGSAQLGLRIVSSRTQKT
ncbi:hypothetical protein B0T11DRAFT_129537 [Plectosphaerella cucumerina]|uniref:Uncharacterized protein n=1 Tax=Plectosphaerella cucumerina TaxID=40658 RepID=A0A8K0WYT7_9PEZI|nr:hypothetical protein B0T11DRAFT_129537 [Plectosphaerella cucumerina]